jgi:hypothetical protein
VHVVSLQVTNFPYFPFVRLPALPASGRLSGRQAQSGQTNIHDDNVDRFQLSLKTKIIFSVIITYILNQLTNEIRIVRYQSVFNIGTDKVT